LDCALIELLIKNIWKVLQ